MCDMCKKDVPNYGQLMKNSFSTDEKRIGFSKELSSEIPLLSRFLYSSMKWPVVFNSPMFEARRAYAVPSAYYQDLKLDNDRTGIGFSHGSMRSLFFIGSRLVLLSKGVGHHDGKEFMSSYVLCHFEPSEFHAEIRGEDITISVDVEKTFRNLVTDKKEKKQISFMFVNKDVHKKLVSREQVLNSSKFKSVYSKYGGAFQKSASIDLEGYAITVPHFSPHPFMLQSFQEFGYSSKREMQESTAKDYFLKHLS